MLDPDAEVDSIDRRRVLGAFEGDCVAATHRFPAGPMIIDFAETFRESTRASVMAATASAVEKSLRNTMGMEEITHADPCRLVAAETGDAVGAGVGSMDGKLFFFVLNSGALVKYLF
jgi:hypothetical protein